jgi:glutamate/tyrosine decarboxylase-like PLP-dependent enzyme
MHQPLAHDHADFRRLLDLAADYGAAYLERIDTLPAAVPYAPPAFNRLEEAGLGGEATLRLFAARFGDAMPASNGPRFWGFVTGGTTPASVMGDWLASVYDVNMPVRENSPAPGIEDEAIALLRELFGLPDAFSGTFVSGATMANLTGLATGREWLAAQRGMSVARDGLGALPRIRVLSGEPHSSSLKALSILGIGRAAVTHVPVLPDDREAVDLPALAHALQSDPGSPTIVIANAGTVNTVDFDDLRAIAAMRAIAPFWLHVDAAFGGFAACAPRFAERMNGLELADSITIDAHKWLNVPYDSAMVFTRHAALQAQVFQNTAAYIGDVGDPPDYVHMAPESSRRLRALPAWFSLMAYGRAGYRAIVENCCACAADLAAQIDVSARFRLLAPARMNVVCFTLRDAPTAERISAFARALRDDGRVFLTPTRFKGLPGLRAAFSNWRTTAADVALGWEAFNAAAASLDRDNPGRAH